MKNNVALIQCNLTLVFEILATCNVSKKRHSCSPKTTIKETSSSGCSMMVLVIMERFLKLKYCEMVLLCGEYGRNARSAASLNRQLISTDLRLSHQTILSVVN